LRVLGHSFELKELVVTVTPLYAGLLAIWFLVLSIRVILGRSGAGNPSLRSVGIAPTLVSLFGAGPLCVYAGLRAI